MKYITGWIYTWWLLFVNAHPLNAGPSMKEQTGILSESNSEVTDASYVRVSATPWESASKTKLEEDYVLVNSAMLPETVQPRTSLNLGEEWVHISEIVDMNLSSLTELEKDYVRVPEPPVETTQPGVLWTEMEREYVAYFEKLEKGGEARWKVWRILKAYWRTALFKICQQAYIVSHPPLSEAPNIQQILYKLVPAELMVGSKTYKNFRMDVDVLECESDKFAKLYLIEGRHENSVYFVKPVSIGRPEKQYLAGSLVAHMIQEETVQENSHHGTVSL